MSRGRVWPPKYNDPYARVVELKARISELEAENKELREKIDAVLDLITRDTEWRKGVGFISAEKPTHGPCCTCQTCGRYHDDCVCVHNEWFHDLLSIGVIDADGGPQ